MDQEREYEIRNRAYELWEIAGRPNGQHLTFWLLAEKEYPIELLEDKLQRELEDTFPASDPPSSTMRAPAKEP